MVGKVGRRGSMEPQQEAEQWYLLPHRKQREQIGKWGEARSSQSLPSVTYFLQQAHTAFLKSNTKAGASVQISEPMGDISHSNHTRTLWSPEKLMLFKQAGLGCFVSAG